MDDSTGTYPDWEPPFSWSVVPWLAAVLITLMVIGLVGNILTIFVIRKSSNLKNDPFMNVLISLCCSDLLSASVSWILLYRRTWGFENFAPLPNFFCKLFFAVDLMTSFSTSMHVLFFALMRLRALRFPFSVVSLKLSRIRVVLLTLWLLSFCFGFVPMYMFSEARVRDRTGDNPDARWPSCTLNTEMLGIHRIYQFVTYSAFVFVPALGIIVTSSLIHRFVHARNRFMTSSACVTSRMRRKEKQASLQVLLIVFLFLVGYIPMTGYDLWALGELPSTEYYRDLDYWLGMGAYISLRTAESFNPIIYNLGSSKIRARTLFYLGKWTGRASKVTGLGDSTVQADSSQPALHAGATSGATTGAKGVKSISAAVTTSI